MYTEIEVSQRSALPSEDNLHPAPATLLLPRLLNASGSECTETHTSRRSSVFRDTPDNVGSKARGKLPQDTAAAAEDAGACHSQKV